VSPALRRLAVALVTLAAVVAVAFLLRAVGEPTADGGSAPSSAASPTASASLLVRSPPASASPRTAAANPSGLAEVAASQLPKEARETLALILQGGPYPYERDGVVFGNFERILPQRQQGYYHEYTVRTPGEADRGARRIVAGDAGEKYYTEDHYESFRFIREGQ
jgi:ribonuclease T1